MTVLRIYLADLVHDYLPGNYVLPLNIALITAYLRVTFGKAVDVRLFKSPARLLEALQHAPAPQLVGFSNYSWNQELNRHFMGVVNQWFPEVVICAGGPHIRTDPDGIASYLRHHDVDYYCMFEGEQPLAQLVEHFLSAGPVVKKRRCQTPLLGTAYLSDGTLIYSKLEFKKGTIENIPSPYLTGVLDEFLRSPRWVPILETNRGCPFSCTFCVWGISAMDNVRVFPLERVLEEIRYVARRSPSPRWIFADANFGMLERDVEIAREIRQAADRYGILKSAYLWWAKNSSRNTVQIARILGSLSDPLAAVQTMDPTVLKIIKRDNIKLSTMTDLLDHFRAMKVKAATDVLVGLPGESLQSHLQTLRKVFSLGFDHIDVGNIRMLPGSEMEGDECRNLYQLKTKYRLIAGSYGKYGGQPIFEFEESVRSSRDIEEAEMHSLRLLHFFVWAFWNLGIAKPLLRWLQMCHGRNPVDVFLSLATRGRSPALDNFLETFDREARDEWFDTSEQLTAYYTERFDELIAKGFLKMNFKYLAKILLDRGFAKHLLEAIGGEKPLGVSEELAQFCFDRIYFLDERFSVKIRTYSQAVVDILKAVYPASGFTSNTCRFELDPTNQRTVDYELERFQFDVNPVRALALTLEAYRSYFLYDFSFSESGEKEMVGDLTGSFDYHAQFGRGSEVGRKETN